MKKMFLGLIALAFVPFITNAQQNSKKTLTWTTSSEKAKELASKGAFHLMNAENELAYSDFSAAVELDPDFTVALTFLATLSKGDARKMLVERAHKSAQNKTEGEKIFSTLADEKGTGLSFSQTMEKLHSMFPDGAVIGHFYVNSRPTADERFAAATAYMKQFPDQACIYNTMAYYYMLDKKDFAAAKPYLDKYLAMYPDGANAYDSMGEYYMNTGDMANAEIYYKKAVEKYPFNASSLAALDKIKAAKPVAANVKN